MIDELIERAEKGEGADRTPWQRFAASEYSGRWLSMHSFFHRWLLTDKEQHDGR